MLKEMLRWILIDHPGAVIITMVSAILIIAVIVHLIDKHDKVKKAATTTTPAPKNKKSRKWPIVGVIVPLCILGGVVYGLYWLWANFVRGAKFDLTWLKYVGYALLVIIPLILMWKLGFFKWLSARNAKRKADAIAAAAAAAASGGKPKKSLFKSLYFWIPICLLVAGCLGYYFRDPIWNWGVGIISTTWWREMMPLWITIAALIVLIFLFWMIGKDSFGKLIARIIGLAIIVLAIWFVLSLWNGFVRMLPNSSSIAGNGGTNVPSAQTQQRTVNELIVPSNSNEEWAVIDVAVWEDTVPEPGKTVIVYAQSRPGEGPPRLRDVYSGNVAGRVTYLTDATTSELSPWRDGKIFLISADNAPVKVRCMRR